MKNKIWLLTAIGIVLFSACGGSSSKEAKVLQQKIINLVGIPQDIVANICQDDNTNGVCESTELQAKVSFNKGDSMQTIWSKLTLTQEGRYLLETHDPSKPLLLELKDAKSPHFTDTFTLPFKGLNESQKEKELSILEAMIDKNVLLPQNVSSARVMKNVDDFYKILLDDLEENIKILKGKGLTTKQAVAGNINEMSEELITNGIENTIPAKMNACNGNPTCVNGVLTTLSTELVLTDAEATSIAEKVEINEPEVIDNNLNKGKIDLAEYLPLTSVTKKFTTKNITPFQEESTSTSSEVISKNKNTLTFQSLNEDKSGYSTATINNDNILVQWNNVEYDNKEYKMNRYINKGDSTWKWAYTYKSDQITLKIKYTCQLEEILNNFSHGGYKYTGDIIVEKCLINTTTTYSINDELEILESSLISYNYKQKNVGQVVSIMNICYDEQGITHSDEGCTVNGHTYTYLEP
jgi:hypothetical protein